MDSHGNAGIIFGQTCPAELIGIPDPGRDAGLIDRFVRRVGGKRCRQASVLVWLMLADIFPGRRLD